MGYDLALNKAWDELFKSGAPREKSVKFLGDEYSLDYEQKKVLSLSCNAPAKDFTAILILHYLAQAAKGLPATTGKWLTFRELSGIEGYYPAFRARAIDPIVRKHAHSPQGIFSVLDRLPGKKAERGDASIVLFALVGVPVLIALWGPDEDFGPDANMFFDESIKDIFCIEDIVVLAGIICSQL
ncbi:MAG: DUF3786 domain-containing protein [Candidatus Omnitrophica bacterium]|nr:DUF3786 domain-containing protein [Candidatus Omnitrophota bacterium]MDD5653697.1 DUF3786 domain-containing protein [Candidatus Omnitrophota bacterium]